MTSPPNFERDEDHDYQPREEVYVIHQNGYDIYEAVIVSVEGFHYTVHYPEYPNDDQVLDGTSRLLPKNRVNTRIYRNQEAARSEKMIQDLDSNSESDNDDNDEDNDDDFKPLQSPEKKDKKLSKKDKKKLKKLPKKKEPSFVPRPQGARSNPPRGGTHKRYADYDSESE